MSTKLDVYDVYRCTCWLESWKVSQTLSFSSSLCGTFCKIKEKRIKEVTKKRMKRIQVGNEPNE